MLGSVQVVLGILGAVFEFNNSVRCPVPHVMCHLLSVTLYHFLAPSTSGGACWIDCKSLSSRKFRMPPWAPHLRASPRIT